MPFFDSSPVILSGSAHPALATAIARNLGLDPGAMNVGRFPDHEIKVQIGGNIRGKDVFIVQPTHATADRGSDNLLELLIMTDAARRASAERITVVLPYFGYARQDRKDKPRVPITAKLVTSMIQHAGADRFLSIDLHSGQIQGFTDAPFDHLYGWIVLLPVIKSLNLAALSIGSVDLGGATMVGNWRSRIPGSDVVLIDKQRLGDRSTRIRQVIGEVEGRDMVLVDDVLSSGISMEVAARAMQERGARSVRAAVTHGVFCEDCIRRLEEAPITEVYVTDTLPLPSSLPGKFRVCSVAPLLGDAIMDIHNSNSLTHHFGLDGSDVKSE